MHEGIACSAPVDKSLVCRGRVEVVTFWDVKALGIARCVASLQWQKRYSVSCPLTLYTCTFIHFTIRPHKEALERVLHEGRTDIWPVDRTLASGMKCPTHGHRNVPTHHNTIPLLRTSCPPIALPLLSWRDDLRSVLWTLPSQDKYIGRSVEAWVQSACRHDAGQAKCVQAPTEQTYRACNWEAGDDQIATGRGHFHLLWG